MMRPAHVRCSVVHAKRAHIERAICTQAQAQPSTSRAHVHCTCIYSAKSIRNALLSYCVLTRQTHSLYTQYTMYMHTYHRTIFSISFLFFATRSPMSAVSVPSRSHLTHFGVARVLLLLLPPFFFVDLLLRFILTCHKLVSDTEYRQRTHQHTHRHARVLVEAAS